MNSYENVEIRPLESSDVKGAIDVLSEAAYSLVWPGFILTTRKTSFRLLIIFLMAASMVVSDGSIKITAFVGITFSFLGYLSHFLAALLYIKCNLVFRDMRNPMKEYRSSPNNNFWVAVTREDDQQVIIGTIAIIESTIVSRSAKMRRMAVLKRYRGRGIADRLVKTAIKFSKDRNYKNINLVTTEAHQAAVELYKKIGFNCNGYEPQKYLAGMLQVWMYQFQYDL